MKKLSDKEKLISTMVDKLNIMTDVRDCPFYANPQESCMKLMGNATLDCNRCFIERSFKKFEKYFRGVNLKC
jgi:hypothetical protein